MNTHIIGVAGEDCAVKYLQKHGYTILERNFKCKFGEIDIVATHKRFVVFIEVKSRKNDAFGQPREAVTDYKQSRIISCATYWLYLRKRTGVPIRFDVVEVVNGAVNVIEDAFRP
ncbi:MAG: YraN family protein [Corallococcus sp.]|nr:YraN family protein [Bacillota bacterium]MCM1533530.1 YraN family protein [Corallococcus sp.]